LQQYHDRGFSGAVGENVPYLAREARGRELAVMVFGAAAGKVAARDQFLGWSVQQRAERLNGIANQQRVSGVARARKDLVLCRRAPAPGPRFYGKTKFPPERVRRRDSLAPGQTAPIFHGGCFRQVPFKELAPGYWQGGARRRPVRLLVVAPVGYRTSKNGRKYYRQPAYLLTTDLTTPAAVLLQDDLDRWGIEVNHRDEKEILGVGQAQVWNEQSVSKVPVLLVAMYSWLLLAGLACVGPQRTADYPPLPKWRRGAKRPSCLDLVTRLRQQLAEHPTTLATAAAPPSYQTMVQAAAA